MKYVQLERFGVPSEVCRCLDGPEPAAPGPGEVTLQMQACPINPAELLIIEGAYASRPELPARLGIEGVGRVLETGAGVETLTVGDRVMSLGRQNWAERVCLPAEHVIKLEVAVDPLQLSMLKVNPATALLMLRRYVTLQPGDWVIQNAANSAVGQVLIQLARAQGLHTANVVRRESLAEPLGAIGADVVVVDGERLAERVHEATGGVDIELGIDAVAGGATQRLAECLSEGATVVSYGLLSGEPCRVTPEQTIFGGITLTGFWLAKVMREMPRGELESMYAELAAAMAAGRVRIPIEATYGLDDIAAALAHAARGHRDGKVLLTPAGAVA